MSENPGSPPLKPRRRWDDQNPPKPDLPMFAQQHSTEQYEQDKPPTKSQGITADQEKEVEGAPVVQGEGKGPVLEATQQELPYEKTGYEYGDDPDVKGKALPNPELTEVLEEEEEKPLV